MTTIETPTDFTGSLRNMPATPVQGWQRTMLLSLAFVATLGVVYGAFAAIGQESAASDDLSSAERQLATTSPGDHLFLLGSDMVVFSNHIDIAWALLGSPAAKSAWATDTDAAAPAMLAHL